MLNGTWRQTPLDSKWILSSNRPHDQEFFQSSVLFMIPSVSAHLPCYQPNSCFKTYVESSQIGIILFRRSTRYDRSDGWQIFLNCRSFPSIAALSQLVLTSSPQVNCTISLMPQKPVLDQSPTVVLSMGRVLFSFLCAQSRVAHLKTITIPPLELSAAAISVKQNKVLKRELEIQLFPIQCRGITLCEKRNEAIPHLCSQSCRSYL